MRQAKREEGERIGRRGARDVGQGVVVGHSDVHPRTNKKRTGGFEEARRGSVCRGRPRRREDE